MKRKTLSVRVVPASRAKNNFGEVIRRVYENEETQVIERDGLPVAAIISMSDLERLYPESQHAGSVYAERKIESKLKVS